MKNTLLVLAGAAAGGVLGYYAAFWVASQGVYAPVLPGMLLGFGAGIARNRSVLLAVVCGLAALGLGLFTEWRIAPFIDDRSLRYFLTHVTDLKPITLIMIALGGLFGFWVPFRRIQPVRR
jgi:hypothetical protein